MISYNQKVSLLVNFLFVICHNCITSGLRTMSTPAILWRDFVMQVKSCDKIAVRNCTLLLLLLHHFSPFTTLLHKLSAQTGKMLAIFSFFELLICNRANYKKASIHWQDSAPPISGSATGQPVSRTQASDAMTSRLPRYEAKCVQCRCVQWGSVPLRSDIKGTEPVSSSC